MTIKAKILCLVAAFACLAFAITGLSLKTISDYNKVIDDYRHASDNAFRAERLNRYMSAAALEMRGIYMSQDMSEVGVYAARTDAAANRLAQFLADWKRLRKPGELSQFDSVFENAGKVAGGGHFIADYARARGRDAAYKIGNTPDHIRFREETQNRLDAMVSQINAQQVRSQAVLARFEGQRQSQFLIVAVSGIALLVAASLWIAIGAIAAPLNRVRRSMVEISEGAYETPIPNTGSGEIGQLWRALDILKSRAIEARRLSDEEIVRQQKLRELVLD